VELAVSDRAGNRGRASWAFTSDTAPPQVVVETPAPGGMTNEVTIQVSGQASDENGIAGVQVGGLPARSTRRRPLAETYRDPSSFLHSRLDPKCRLAVPGPISM
jgi:hypothetical protein